MSSLKDAGLRKRRNGGTEAYPAGLKDNKGAPDTQMEAKDLRQARQGRAFQPGHSGRQYCSTLFPGLEKSIDIKFRRDLAHPASCTNA